MEVRLGKEKSQRLHLVHELFRESDLRAYINLSLLLGRSWESNVVRIRHSGDDFAG